jgi:hypothetical protein
MKTIKYPSLTWFTGRNGLFKAAGIKVTKTHDNHIHLIPITSKGKEAHCDIIIHSQSIPDVMLSISEQYQNKKSINSDPLHEIAMIAAIMGDHDCIEKAKKATYNKKGYIDTVELMGRWAVEFYQTYKDFDWEQLYEQPVMEGINNKVDCWDEAIIEFTLQKIESL